MLYPSGGIGMTQRGLKYPPPSARINSKAPSCEDNLGYSVSRTVFSLENFEPLSVLYHLTGRNHVSKTSWVENRLSAFLLVLDAGSQTSDLLHQDLRTLACEHINFILFTVPEAKGYVLLILHLEVLPE